MTYGNTLLAFFIVEEEHYQDQDRVQEEAYLAGIRASLEDADAGRVRPVSAQELIERSGLGG